MVLALPDTVTFLGADIPFWYAAGSFALVLVAMGGEHQILLHVCASKTSGSVCDPPLSRSRWQRFRSWNRSWQRSLGRMCC